MSSFLTLRLRAGEGAAGGGEAPLDTPRRTLISLKYNRTLSFNKHWNRVKTMHRGSCHNKNYHVYIALVIWLSVLDPLIWLSSNLIIEWFTTFNIKICDSPHTRTIHTYQGTLGAAFKLIKTKYTLIYLTFYILIIMYKRTKVQKKSTDIY